jgi:plastocyanin
MRFHRNHVGVSKELTMRLSISRGLITLFVSAATLPFIALVDRGHDPKTLGNPSSSPAKAPASQPAGPSVSIDNFSFSPTTITVLAGTTVTWINHDDVPHTVTANDKGFASKAMDTDDQFSHRFVTPGTFAYFCAVHPHMTGQVIVK